MLHKLCPARLALFVVLLSVLPGWADDRAHQLAAQAASQATAHCNNVTTLAECHPGHPTGCSHAQNPRYDAYLNFLKNQQPARDLAPDRAPDMSDFMNLEDAIPAGIGRSNHAQFANQLAELGEGNIYAVVPYLYFVEDRAVTSRHHGETCNCQLEGAGTFDFHLGIGFDPAVAQQIRRNPPVHDPTHPGPPEQTSVVAEITPHTRDTKWTEARLNRQRGKRVKVVGQLMLDNPHVNTTDDCAFFEDPGGSCWRASAWEIHPGIQFFVCKRGKTCTESSPDSDWVRLEDLP